jgi:hypothetical protein
VQTIAKTSRTFKLSQMPLVFYSAANVIDVAVDVGSGFGAYGPACNVTTPAISSTKIITSQCGITLGSIYTGIYADEVPGVAMYRFRLTKDGGANYIYVDKPTRMFRFGYDLSTGQYTTSTTYSVDVAVNYNSIWLSYGAACNITTPGTYTNPPPRDNTDEITRADENTEPQTAMTIDDNTSKDIFDISVYPNPFGETFNLVSNSLSNEKVLISVFDIVGKEVETIETNSDNLKNVSIGNNYNWGIYYIRFKQGDNSKIIKVIRYK